MCWSLISPECRSVGECFDKTRNPREREKHRARSNRKWLEPPKDTLAGSAQDKSPCEVDINESLVDGRVEGRTRVHVESEVVLKCEANNNEGSCDMLCWMWEQLFYETQRFQLTRWLKSWATREKHVCWSATYAWVWCSVYTLRRLQEENVEGVVNFSNWSSDICSLCCTAREFCVIAAGEWIHGWRPSCRHQHWNCAPNSFFTFRDKSPGTLLHGAGNVR